MKKLRAEYVITNYTEIIGKRLDLTYRVLENLESPGIPFWIFCSDSILCLRKKISALWQHYLHAYYVKAQQAAFSSQILSSFRPQWLRRRCITTCAWRRCRETRLTCFSDWRLREQLFRLNPGTECSNSFQPSKMYVYSDKWEIREKVVILLRNVQEAILQLCI